MWNLFYTILTIIYFANIVMAAFIIFFGRRNPANTWVWLILLVMAPGVGLALYLICGQDVKKERQFRRKNEFDKKLREQFFETVNDGYFQKVLDFQSCGFKHKDIDETIKDFYSYSLSDVVNYSLQVESAYITGDNFIKVFNNGEEKVDDLLNNILNAKKYIHMEYYIINNDKTGNMLADALAKKAAEGLEVKVLFDGMGCLRTGRKFFRKVTEAGGEVSNFLPPLIPSVNIRLNYRNHRKIAVIDGNIGYVGGINIGDEYLGKVKKFGFWRDMHLRIEGGAVSQLQKRFIMDWNFASKSKLNLSPMYFPFTKDDFTGKRVQIISSGPDTDHANIKNLYFKMINEAKKSVYFTTPYFVPDDSILNALKVAALSGIDVRLIFPGKPDHPFVYWASLSYVSELLQAGVKCFQYRNGFIHSKMIVADGVVSSVGTANMDIRSFDLNFETNAIIYDEEIGGILNKQFFLDQEDSEEITEEWYKKRPNSYKVKEAVSRLISPLL